MLTRAHPLPRLLAAAWLAGCSTTTEPPAALPADEDASAVDEIVARWDGGELTRSELERRLKAELRQMDIQYRLNRYERLYEALDAIVEDAVLREAVAKRGVPDKDALLDAEVERRMVEPPEDALREEFERFREQVPGASWESARPFLRKELLKNQREVIRHEVVKELEAEARLEVLLRFPDIPRIDIPIREHDPVLGAADAPVTIVQFGGYQCYYCKRVHDVLLQLVDRYEGQVRLVYKDFPLAGHGRASSAAVAAHCAGEQDAYWPMSTILLQNQGRLEPDHLAGYARRLELDLPAWERCIDDPSWRRHIDADVHDGREAGVTSTPTFFFNGLMLTGAHDYQRLAALVEQELARLGVR